MTIRAILWDFGGVVTSSPFEAFARLERERGLPAGFIRRINTSNPHANAWARLERSEIGIEAFCELFEAEARAAGHAVDARAVLACLAGRIRPEMVAAIGALRPRYKLACLTNNVRGIGRTAEQEGEIAAVMRLFDLVVESSRVGARKPEPRFYERACGLLGVAPEDCVFLDDLGINLKPARAMGMTTIKVDDPAQALAELERVLGHPLGAPAPAAAERRVTPS